MPVHRLIGVEAHGDSVDSLLRFPDISSTRIIEESSIWFMLQRVSCGLSEPRGSIGNCRL